MTSLPEVPVGQKLTNEQLLSYLWRLVEALQICIDELDERTRNNESEER